MHAAHATARARSVHHSREKKGDRDREKDKGEKEREREKEREDVCWWKKKKIRKGTRDEETARRCSSPPKPRH